MSEIVQYTGKFKQVDLQGLTIDEFFQQKCEELGYEKTSKYDTFQDVYSLNTDKYNYFTCNNSLFEILEKNKEEDTEYITVLTENQDGTYNYISQFYTGCTFLTEQLSESLYGILK